MRKENQVSLTRRMPVQAIGMETSRRIISTPAGEKTKRTGGSERTASAWRRAWRSGATAHHTTQATRNQKATPGTKFLQGAAHRSSIDRNVVRDEEGAQVVTRRGWCAQSEAMTENSGACRGDRATTVSGFAVAFTTKGVPRRSS